MSNAPRLETLQVNTVIKFLVFKSKIQRKKKPPTKRKCTIIKRITLEITSGKHWLSQNAAKNVGRANQLIGSWFISIVILWTDFLVSWLIEQRQNEEPTKKKTQKPWKKTPIIFKTLRNYRSSTQITTKSTRALENLPGRGKEENESEGACILGYLLYLLSF